MSAEKSDKNLNKKLNKDKNGKNNRAVCGAAGLVLCAFLAGCGETDRAISLPVGELVETTEQTEAAKSAEAAEQTEAAKQGAESASLPEEAVIYVYVCGAVKEPGVVVLPEGSRGQDALEAAGGFAEDAALEAVNLAEVLTDGMKLYFPTPEEAVEAEREAQERDAGLIDINTAGVELLCTLPGIGEARANAIIAYREEHGAFGSTEEIMRVSGIKDSAYNKIKALITVK